MPFALHRYQDCGDLHFLTFSCYRRLPYLGTGQARDLFESALERVRKKYRCAILGYVVMPEHVHMLVNEPARSTLDQFMKSIKLSVRYAGRSGPSGRPVTTISTCGQNRSVSRKCAICSAIRWRAAWYRSPRTGHGPAFAITQRGSKGRWKSSRSGPTGAGSTAGFSPTSKKARDMGHPLPNLTFPVQQTDEFSSGRTSPVR